MAYCLACGKLADTHGGFCSQCAVDMQATRPKPKRVKVNRYANGNERRGNKSLESLNAPPKPRAKDVGCKTSFSW